MVAQARSPWRARQGVSLAEARQSALGDWRCTALRAAPHTAGAWLGAWRLRKHACPTTRAGGAAPRHRPSDHSCHDHSSMTARAAA